MRRSAQSWNGCAPPPATRTLSTPASWTTALRSVSSSASSAGQPACTELFSSIMLWVISGFPAPGSLRFWSRRRRSAASRERSRSCGRTSCSSSSTPTLRAAEAVKTGSSMWLRFPGAAQRELRRERADELQEHYRRQHHRGELTSEGWIERRGVAHHHHGRSGKGNQRERDQARAAGAD